MHDQFFEQLSTVAKVRLAAKLKEDSIGLDHPEEIRIFFPDMHIISKEQQAKFNFANYVNYNKDKDDLLPTVARFMSKFKKDNTDKKIMVYQLGDFLDPWRETDKPFKLDPIGFQGMIQEIIESNKDVCDAFLDDDLHTNFILGNHDFDLHRIPTLFDRFQHIKFYIYNHESIPSAAIFHGDIFSWAERFPDWLQQFMVFHFSPKNKSKKFMKKLDAEIRNTHKVKGKFPDYKNEKEPRNLYNMGKLEDPGSVTRDRWNLMKPGEADRNQLSRLSQAKILIEKINKKTNYQVKMAVIGHTHKARIAVDERGEKPFFLMDCGAWLKKSKALVKKSGEWVEEVVDNAQIGVLYRNDARIYQLSPLDA